MFLTIAFFKPNPVERNTRNPAMISKTTPSTIRNTFFFLFIILPPIKWFMYPHANIAEKHTISASTI